jgi:hypothetical protein
MFRVDVSRSIVAASKWQFMAALSVWTRVGGTIVDGAARCETVRERMPGEISRGSCLMLAHRADVRLHVRVQMPPDIY